LCRLKKKSRPAARKNLKLKVRYFNYLVVSDENENTLIQREPLKEFGKIYEFPLIETAKEEFGCRTD
jgi:A/G-specific adenine glycosylase